MKVLFVCRGNVGRSQMAAVLFTKYSGIKAFSAGTKVFEGENQKIKELSLAEIKSSALNITRLSKEKKILARYILFFPFEIFRLYLFFRKHTFDLVHVNGSYQFKVAIAAKLAGIPVVWHFNDTSMDIIVKKTCTILAGYCSSGLIVAGKRVRDYYIQGNSMLEHLF